MAAIPSTVGRLSLMFFVIALATSRITLILHELVGHGGVALAFGSTIEDYHLFWFAGGYIEFARPQPYHLGEELAIFLGGIGLELVLGIVALALARKLRASLGETARLMLLCYATINLIHAGYYLTAGTFHGFGDGWVLHRALGASRIYAIGPLAIALLVATFVLARHIASVVRSRLPGVRRPLVVIGASAVIAAAGHAALSFGELAVSPNPIYKVTMRHQSERDVQRDLAVYVREVQTDRGATPDPRELARKRSELREHHEEFPFARLLIAALAMAALLGMARSSSPGESATLHWSDLRLPGLLLALSMAAVAVLKLV